MIWLRRDRAAALAAVALVVGAGHEPVAALRALAAGDPGLGVLNALAARLHAGVPLANALVACRLFTSADAADLGLLPQDALTEALGQQAQQAARPRVVDALARWFPLWAVLAASVPCLAIGLVVRVVSGSDFGGAFDFYRWPYVAPTPWWMQAAAVLVALTVVGLWWWLLRITPVLRLATVFSHAGERAAQTSALLWAARAGRADESAWHRWADWCGDAHAREVAENAGGDAAAALVALGVLARRADGGLDWDDALADQQRARNRAADALQPLLLVTLAGLVVHGVVSWSTTGPSSGFDLGSLLPGSSWNGPLAHGLGSVLTLGISAIIAVIVVHVLALGLALLRLLAGAGRDWPLVADRVARAIERRDDPDVALRGLRLIVGRAMRRRLERALADREALPGRRLVAAGVVPAAQARTIAAAEGADLPALLYLAAAPVDDHGMRAAVIQGGLVALLIALIAGIVAPAYEQLMRSTTASGIGFEPALGMFSGQIVGLVSMGFADWISAGRTSALTLIAVMTLVVLVATIATRRGWLGGWTTLTRGLVLRRLLAQGADEATCARVIGIGSTRGDARARAAAARGDLPALMAAVGWPVATPAALDRAINAGLIARDRRRAQAGLLVRLVLPMLTAVPVALVSIGVISGFMSVERDGIARAQRGAELFGGAAQLPTTMIIRYWVERSEDAGQAAVDLIRPPPASPVIAPGVGP